MIRRRKPRFCLYGSTEDNLKYNRLFRGASVKAEIVHVVESVCLMTCVMKLNSWEWVCAYGLARRTEHDLLFVD